MTRHLAIVLYFRAPLGGLHENVIATARFAKRAGWRVAILCPDGPFLQEHVLAAGIEGIAVDFSDLASTLAAIAYLRSATIIHAHPGPSKLLALEASRQVGTPVFFTIHGRWFNSVGDDAGRLACIVCVSPAIREQVASACGRFADKVVCIPNGTDAYLFPPLSAGPPGACKSVAIVSRFDEDKRVVVDTVVGLWREMAARDADSPRWVLVGDGALMSELRAAAEELNRAKGRTVVEFAGWQSPQALPAAYAGADLVLGSGRCAIEALAMGRPAMAIGSIGLVSISSRERLVEASQSNFGGYGSAPVPPIGDLLDEILDVLDRDNAQFGHEACQFIRSHHADAVVNGHLLSLYDTAARAAGPSASPAGVRA